MHQHDQYILDKSYADFLMLAEDGEEFDPFKTINDISDHKKEIYNKNKRLSLPTSSTRSVNKWLSKLNVGDKLWMDPRYGDQPSSSYITIKSIRESRSIDGKKDFTLEVDDLHYNGWGLNVWNKCITSETFRWKHVWNTKPFDYKDEI